jgi:uncharacterized protein GlcG (DUF336 family)
LTQFLESIPMPLQLKMWVVSVVLCAQAQAQEAVFQTRSLTPETALTAARAALEACRKKGYQVTVAVVDRAGITQVLLRDRFAGPHTIDVATNKAWTAASMRMSTTVFGVETQPGKPMSGLRSHARVMAAGGGLVIEGGGSLFGGIGVSGAPGGDADEACAREGLKSIADALEF